jgi:hypothetical protein
MTASKISSILRRAVAEFYRCRRPAHLCNECDSKHAFVALALNLRCGSHVVKRASAGLPRRNDEQNGSQGKNPAIIVMKQNYFTMNRANLRRT